MFNSSLSEHEELVVKPPLRRAAQRASKRRGGDRSTVGAVDAAAQQDPALPMVSSPNSRQSRGRPRAAGSSHSQGRDQAMTASVESAASRVFVGVDVAKKSWDVHLLPSGKSLKLAA